MLTRSLVILTAFAALALMGCGTPDAPGAALAVRSSLVEGEIGGLALDDARLGPLSGHMTGAQLAFSASAGPSLLSVELCDPAQTVIEDPYGTLGGGRFFPPSGPCIDQVLYCDDAANCTGFGDLDIESIAVPGGDLLVVDGADGANNRVHVEIEYGEL